MSELQVSLVVLGATIVAGIWAYNLWQARRHRAVAESLVRRDADDVLLASSDVVAPAESGDDDLPVEELAPPPASAGRVEPTLGNLRAPAMVEKSAPHNAESPAVAAHPEAAATAPSSQPPGADEPSGAVAEAEDAFSPPPHFLSRSVDYIAAFEALEAIPGDQILQSQGDVLRSIGKRVAWVGFDETLPAWEFCRSGAAYRRLRIGVQLADRHGPLDESGLNSFYSAMQHFADEITAVADLPPRRLALESAQRLDRVCAGVDIQVGVNVVSKGASFPGTKIRALAEAAGMVIEADGAYVRRDDDGRLLYTLHAHDSEGFSAEAMRSMSAHGLTFLLDVPRVANGDRVFNHMVDVARRFAETLQGQLVDDNRRPITEQFLTPIRKQIGQYQATMASQGLPAGSDVALRLFS